MKKSELLMQLLYQYELNIQFVSSLVILIKNKQLTEEYLTRQIDNDYRNLKALKLFLEEMKLEKNAVLKSIKEIAVKFNDRDLEIISLYLQHKKTSEIEAELNVKYKRVLRVITDFEREVRNINLLSEKELMKIFNEDKKEEEEEEDEPRE